MKVGYSYLPTCSTCGRNMQSTVQSRNVQFQNMITYCSTVRPSYSQMKRTPQVGRESVQITAMKSNESDHHSLE